MTPYALQLRWLAVLGALAVAVLLISTCGDRTSNEHVPSDAHKHIYARSNAFSDSAVQHYR